MPQAHAWQAGSGHWVCKCSDSGRAISYHDTREEAEAAAGKINAEHAAKQERELQLREQMLAEGEGQLTADRRAAADEIRAEEAEAQKRIDEQAHAKSEELTERERILADKEALMADREAAEVARLEAEQPGEELVSGGTAEPAEPAEPAEG